MARRVLLIRHGSSEANESGRDIPDPLLSEDGRTQARSWCDHVDEFGVDLVLASPLRRAVETACLMFGSSKAPIEVCYPARELWWHHRQNVPGTSAQLSALLSRLPRGDSVSKQECLDDSRHPATEEASVSELRSVLSARTEKTIAVVCHYLLIQELCGASANNGETIVCDLGDAGRLKVVQRHQPPGGPRTCW